MTLDTRDSRHDSSVDKVDVVYKETVDDVEYGKGGNRVADDVADGYVNPDIVISPEENKRLRRMIHKRVLPLLCLAYLLQALDKGTLGTASIMGWQQDVGAKGQDYSLTSTLLWAGIIVGEPIANQAVRRLPLAKLLAAGCFIWSCLLLGLAFSLSIPPVFAVRFLLGFFESLVGPCLLSITVQWYLAAEQPLVQACWQCMLGLQNCISGLLGFGFYHIKNAKGLHGWQWLTVGVALFSFLCSFIIFVFLPDAPTKARWATEDEKVMFVERVRANNQGLKHKVFKKDQLIEALTDPYSLCLFGMAFFQTLVVGGINTFANLLINQAFGFTVLESQLLNIPLGVMTVAMYFLISFLITKFNQTLFTMMLFTVPNIVGTIVLLTVAPSSKTRGGLVVAFYAMQVFQACNPAIFLMLSRNSAGQTKKSVTYAITYIGWAGGNACAPQLFKSYWAPRYSNSLYIHIGLYGVFNCILLATRFLLVRRNKAKVAARKGAAVTNAMAFEDMTDIQNPDFHYSL